MTHRQSQGPTLALINAGLTYRQIDHAVTTGLLHPHQAHPGPGGHREWTTEQLTTLATLLPVWPNARLLNTAAQHRRRVAHRQLEQHLNRTQPDAWPTTILIGALGQIGFPDPNFTDIADHLEGSHVLTSTPLVHTKAGT